MIKYPKIRQFKDVIRAVVREASFVGLDEDENPIYDHNAQMPTLPFRGTVKLHGSNGSVVVLPDNTINAQSRNRTLNPLSDNNGFASFVFGSVGNSTWVSLADRLNNNAIRTQPVVIYGEWCGENIQKGVALSQLSKRFIVFGLRVGAEEETTWVDIRGHGSLDMDDKLVFSIHDDRFPCYNIDINFESPSLSQNKLIDITNAVEASCPVGKAFGAEGIGEGVVWSCISEKYNNSGYWFKVKGKLHSSSKVRTIAPVNIEKVKSIHEFVSRTVTENRCLQAIEFLKEHDLELSQKSTGQYIKWIVGDIIKEELDSLTKSGLDPSLVARPIGTAARMWYFNHIDNLIGL